MQKYNNKLILKFPCKILDELVEHFKDKKVIDLCCSDANNMIYIKNKLGCKEIFGIDYFNNLTENLDQYGIGVHKGNFLQFDFTVYNTFFLWIEDFLFEKQLINILKCLNNKCTIIIAYNTKSNCKKSNLDFNSIKNNIFNKLIFTAKIKAMNYSPYLLKKHAYEQAFDFVTCKDKNCIEINSNNNKFNKLEDFLTQNNFNFEKKNINFNSGNGCCESGIFSFYIVHITSLQKQIKKLPTYKITPKPNETDQEKNERLKLQAKRKILAKEKAKVAQIIKNL